MKAINYYGIINKLSDKEITEFNKGQVVANGILTNIQAHLELYFSDYPKVFKKKENNKVFAGLERLANGESNKILGPDELENIYSKVSEKTTQKVYKINFAYDALNFIASQKGEFDPESLFPYLAKQISILGTKGAAHKIRGMKKQDPKYHLQKTGQTNIEYEYFVNGLKNSLRKIYGAPLL
ncbi:MAG: hypothetical protein ACQESF_05940 [Nanobdellota archaeon]